MLERPITITIQIDPIKHEDLYNKYVEFLKSLDGNIGLANLSVFGIGIDSVLRTKDALRNKHYYYEVYGWS